MKYIKNFETESLYQAAQATLDKPNVSLIKATMGLNYLPYVAPVVQQHDYVEIAGIKWATMNLGANSITDHGLYYQWGDTQGYTAAQVGNGEGQKYFGLDDYKFYDNEINGWIKYNNTDELITLLPEDDAVTAAWGGNWRMPTISEYQVLREAVNYEFTNDYQGSGVAGIICTDKTDSSKVLFFPKSGWCHKGNYYWDDTYNNTSIQYLTSSYDAGYYDGRACSIMFDEYSIGEYSINDYSSYREAGYLIRGILDE